ncbi:MAG: hypothetical protein R2726_04175 [Acidimicrobiales bacterium]
MVPIRWRAVVLWALGGTVVCVAVTLLSLARTYDELGGLVDTRPDHPAAAVILEDMPGEHLTQPGERDGAMYYAIARDPWRLQENARYLDDPPYRYQRLLIPVLSWALHPTGGGVGLVWTMFAVGVVGVLVGAVAAGGLSVTLRGPPWMGLVFALLPGAYTSLRQTCPDAIALGLALLAALLSLRGRSVWAVLAMLAAVFCKESILVVAVGLALWRRDRAGLALAGVPAVVMGTWYVVVRALLPTGFSPTENFMAPFSGWIRAWDYWSEGAFPIGMASSLSAVVLGVVALVLRRFAHPLSYAVALSLLVSVVIRSTSSCRTPTRRGT